MFNRTDGSCRLIFSQVLETLLNKSSSFNEKELKSDSGISVLESWNLIDFC